MKYYESQQGEICDRKFRASTVIGFGKSLLGVDTPTLH
jgi:hypothetical protein